MESLAPFLPYLGWIIAGAFTLGAAGILTSFQTTRMKIKNGYPLEGMWGQSLKPGSDQQTAHRVTLLTQENAELRAELGSIKDRLANVERIVTDDGFHLTQAIDALRDTRRVDVEMGSGTPLGTESRERV